MQIANRELLASLKDSISELGAPLEAAQAEAPEDDATPAQKGQDLLMGDLTMVMLLLADADLSVSKGELELINDMRQTVYGAEAQALSSSDYEELSRALLRLYPRERLTVDVMPISVRYLLAYDKAHGTTYADKARQLFMQFAAAIVIANENEDAVEAMVLANFRDILYPPPA